MTGCPTDQELESLIEDRIAPSEAPADAPTRASSLLTHHLETCERCRARIDELERDRAFMHEIVSALSDVSDPGTTGRSANPTAATLTVAGYDIDGELHRGAQGVVFKAHQRSTNRKVALKVLYHESGTSLRMRQRFLREIELAAQLRHPNVVTIFDSGETEDGRLYFAMEFVEGPRLDAHATALANETRRSPAEYRRRSLQLFDSICAGVAHAHHRGVIHRDLKPGNILLGSDGEPKVLDFGLAKATDADVNSRFALDTIAGSFMGTIAYASPEQTQGNPDGIDTRSDVYALGVLLHELVTGRLPYDVKGSLSDGINNVLHAQPETPMRWRMPDASSGSEGARNVDRDLETIILKALAKEPERRYQTVDGLREDIAHYLAGAPITARRDSPVYIATQHAKRHGGKIALGLMFAAAFAAIVWLYDALSTTQLDVLQATERVDRYAAQLAQQEMWDATSGAARLPALAPSNAGAIDREATIVVNAPRRPETLNPTDMQIGELFVCELLFERLFWRTERLELVPNAHLVESITEDNDPTIKTIRLRPDLTWHDGSPLTAADIVYSWRQAVSPDVNTTKRRQASRIKEIVATDARTATIHLESPHATWRLSANFELIPKHVFEFGDAEDPTLRVSQYFEKVHRLPIGSGPFKFEAWDDVEIRTVRFEDYDASGLSPSIAGITIRWIDSPDAKLDAFLKGELDLVELTEAQYRTRIYTSEFESAGREARRPSSRYHYVGWNCSSADARLNDPEIRRALAIAIDVDRIKSQVTNNLAAACFGPWQPDSPYFDPDVRRFAHKAGMARDILEMPKRSLTNTDELRRRGDIAEQAPSKLNIRLLACETEDGDVKTAEIIRDCLGDVGVGVTIDVAADRPEFLDRLKSGRFDAYLAAITPAVDPELHTSEFTTDGKLNFGGYSNPEVDRLFDEAATTFEETERITIFRRLHRILYEDQPRTFLYHEPALWAVSHRLSGVVFSSRGPYYFQPGVIQWWVGSRSEK
ncbi:MAG: protein kinase [Phycisphaerales bacterium]|nr:protein kinase [Phycisphaerales bacterium]MCB9856588.1 protein kinase [Phycisphaerales bacterium]MCB9864615.1 protein kinase [Phycisphaerales bacterium]